MDVKSARVKDTAAQVPAGSCRYQGMSNHASANASPAPEAGPNPNPTLTVLPDPAPKRRVLSLNRRQLEVITLTDVICTEAKSFDAAPILEPRGITAAFVNALLTDIASARTCASNGVYCTGGAEAATAIEGVKKGTLVKSLRQVQSAAKQLHQFNQPERLHDYLVGEPITQSRPLLEQAAQTIITKANTERPPGIDTDFIVRAETERAQYVQSKVPQVDEQARGKLERALRNQFVDSIKERSKQIQFAANSAWPAGVPANEGFRKRFRLPANRTLSR